MGMQIHFRRADLPDAANCSTGRDDEPGAGYIDCYGHRVYAYSEDGGQSFWFDCGSRSEHQMLQIAFLIEWRVCFNAS